MSNVSEILEERGKRYGEFASHARITQRIKKTMQSSSNWETLDFDKKEALEMIGELEERETEDMSLQSWDKDDYKAFGRNGLRAELRNKFNDKYKED